MRRIFAVTLAAMLAGTPAAPASRKDKVPPPVPRLSKLARILELEDQRSAGAGELERLLHDADPGVRRRAALAAAASRCRSW
jgi:hypothetical protein